ncbi:hypothetical protein PPACK8108_LOCUS5986 [Phakopsora pachyrhizi]|uniref:Uncharacterized protein n=1 Tax=Phakopsora pachyrhizi TaxID=170000 RepID=A0AAV0AQ36_PHAPC|nr:hypothetical protein PPACK8108_LOCUS5986 [Phakopsora pachyrhizi]
MTDLEDRLVIAVEYQLRGHSEIWKKLDQSWLRLHPAAYKEFGKLQLCGGNGMVYKTRKAKESTSRRHGHYQEDRVDKVIGQCLVFGEIGVTHEGYVYGQWEGNISFGGLWEVMAQDTLRMDEIEEAQQQRTEMCSVSWLAGSEACGTGMKPSTGQIKI